MKRIDIDHKTDKPVIAVYCYSLYSASQTIRARILRFEASGEEISRIIKAPTKRTLPIDYAELNQAMRANAKWSVTQLNQIALIEIQRGPEIKRYFVQGTERNGVAGHINTFRSFRATDVLIPSNPKGWVTIKQYGADRGMFNISADVVTESTRPEMCKMVVGKRDKVVSYKDGRLVVCNLSELKSLASGPV